MSDDSKYVLAMYDVRAKQSYIYRTKKLKEIQGASAVIRDVFDDYLFWAAKEARDKTSYTAEEKKYKPDAIYKYTNPEESFSFESFTKRVKDKTDHVSDEYIGEVVYDGGGNFLVLYKNKEICKEVMYRFARRLLKEAPGLNVLCTYKEIENGDDYKKDSEELYNLHRINENQESTLPAWGSLPIVQTDYQTSMPLMPSAYETYLSGEKNEKLTSEADAKYKKFKNEEGDEKILDKIVEEKGRESLLAIIYIDGNNMGARVEGLLDSTAGTYDACVTKLRDFSKYIDDNCVQKRKEQIDEKLKALIQKKTEEQKKQTGSNNSNTDEKTRRLVVGAGDEITIICNARYAFEIVKEYLDNLSKESKTNDQDYDRITSCAGIAIFHSHTPFADAYRIAEECCESGKKRMKELEITDACYLDFHYCQGAIGTSLEDIREHEEMTDCSRPWLMVEPDENEQKKKVSEELSFTDDIKSVIKEINQLGRSNVKGLAESAKDGVLTLETDLKRIISHRKEKKKGLENICKVFIDGNDDENNKKEKEKYRKMIYDIVIVYDLWFDGYEGSEKGGEKSNEKDDADNNSQV